jgi:predicted small integral membrane protein
MMLRLSKILLVACAGLLGLLSGLDNILDYGANFEVVRHVMSMDTTGAGAAMMARAVISDPLHRLLYAAIIATELAYGGLCLVGAQRLFVARRSGAAAFAAAKELAVAGLTLGVLLYFFGFMIMGGEWLQMWRSADWNFQQPAFRFLVSLGIVLIFLATPEALNETA